MTAVLVPVLPAASLNCAVSALLPVLRVTGLLVLQLPSSWTSAVPTAVAPSKMVTVAPALASARSTVPEIVCCAWLVGPPRFLIVTVGAVVSSVMLSAAVVELLPARSLNCAEIALLPSAPRSPATTVRLTLPAVTSAAVMVWVTGCASAEPPSSSCTVSPASSAAPSATVNVGAVTLVMSSLCEMPESDAAARTGVPPPGATVSSVMISAAVVELLPKPSLNCAEIALLPSRPRSPATTARLTLPAVTSAAVMVWVTGCASAEPPSSSCTVSPASSAAPSATVNVGAVTLVMSSLCEMPESDAAARTGVPPPGATVSSVMISAAVVELLPKPSLNCAEIALLPSRPRSPATTARLTLPAVTSAAVMVWVTGCASAEPPSSSCTVSPASSAAPSATVNVGAVTLVMSSLCEMPESDAAARTGVPPPGATVSSVMISAAVVELLPKPSLNCAEIALLPSAPRSPATTARLTLPAVTSAAVMVWLTGCASAEPPSNSWTVSPASSAAPSATVKLGAVTLVMSSLCEMPESDAAARTGVPPLGATVSSVTISAAVVELLPKPSLNCPEIALLPSAPRSPATTARLTLPAVTSAAVMVWLTGCASAEPPSNSWTVSPASSAAPSATVNVGAVTLVMSSLCEMPESDAAARTGVPPLGATVSSVTISAAVVE